jgi:hypothetical protein
VSKKGSGVLDKSLSLSFDEVSVFSMNAEFLKLTLGMKDLKIHRSDEITDESLKKKVESGEPGNPAFVLSS